MFSFGKGFKRWKHVSEGQSSSTSGTQSSVECDGPGKTKWDEERDEL